MELQLWLEGGYDGDGGGWLGLVGEMVDDGEHSGPVGGYEEAGEWHGLAGLQDGHVGGCDGEAGPSEKDTYNVLLRVHARHVTWSWPALEHHRYGTVSMPALTSSRGEEFVLANERMSRSRY